MLLASDAHGRVVDAGFGSELCKQPFEESPLPGSKRVEAETGEQHRLDDRVL